MRRELADFLDCCRLERRLARLTCSSYERDVGTCLSFREREGIESLAEVRSADLRSSRADEATGVLKPGLHGRRAQGLGFLRFLVENEYLAHDAAHVLRTPKKRDERDDVWERHFPRPSASATGCYSPSSPTPACAAASYSARLDDVDLERRLLHVRKAKAGRQPVIPIHAALEPLFAEYLCFRPRPRADALRRRPQAALNHYVALES